MRILVLLIIGAGLYSGYEWVIRTRVPVTLWMRIEVESKTSVQVFWDTGGGFDQTRSVSGHLRKGVHDVSFAAPLDTRAMRIDPPATKGGLDIHALGLRHLIDVARWGGEDGFDGWTPNGDARCSSSGGVLSVRTGRGDPQLSNILIGRSIDRALMWERILGGAIVALLVALPLFRRRRSPAATPVARTPRAADRLGLKIAVLVGVSAVCALAVYLVYIKVLKRESLQYADETGAYSPSFFNRDGQRISSMDGSLALVLDPFTIYANYPGQATASFTIDENGFRGGIADPRKPKAVVVGGSTAFGHGLASEEDLFTSVLNREVDEFTFVNAAVIGFVSGQECAQVVHRLDRLRPQAYIVLDGWNEVAEQVGTPWRLGVNRQFFAIGRRLHEYSVLAGTDGIATRSFPGGGLDVDKHRPTGDIIGRTYVDNLERMHLLARARDAHFIVMFQPEISSRRKPTKQERDIPRNESLGRDYHALVDFARAACKERGISCIDINGQPEYQDSPETLFFDVVHLTAAGHRVVADIIKRLLREAK